MSHTRTGRVVVAMFLVFAATCVASPADGPSESVPQAPDRMKLDRPIRDALDTITEDELMDHVRYLSDESLEGREAGKTGGRQAADYLAEQLKAMGLEPAGPDQSFFQPFRDQMRNVLARLPGRDPTLAAETIVVSAHFDHLGIRRSRSPGSDAVVYNGANDNASGTAGVLEIAEALASLPEAPRRSILFALWDGEEKGLLGSRHFVANPTVPLEKIVFAIAMDMIGRVSDERFIFWGTGTANGLRYLITRNNVLPDLDLEFRTFNLTLSDHQPFFQKDIPVLMPSSGIYPELHRPEDDVELINADGMQRAAQLVNGIVYDLANRDENFVFLDAARNETTRDPRRPADPVSAGPDDQLVTLGFSCQTDPREPDVAIVAKVAKETPMALAGLASADRIYDIDGVSISLDNRLKELDRRTEPFRMLVERSGRFRSLNVDPTSGTRRAPGLYEPTAVTHSWSNPKPARSIQGEKSARTFAEHTDAVRTIAFSPDGKLLATGSFDNTALLWNLETGEETARLTNHQGVISSLLFSPDGTRLITGSIDKTVRIWNVGSQEEEAILEATAAVQGLAISPDGKLLAAGCGDHMTRIWTLSDARLVTTLSGHTKLVQCLAFAPDGNCLATASWDKNVILWDPKTWQEIKRIATSLELRSIAFSPDGKTIALAGGPSATIWIMDVESGQRKTYLRGHSKWVNSVAFDATGTRLASGSLDQRFVIWDHENRQTMNLIEGHADEVWAVAFSPDGQVLATGSDDGTARLWDIDQLPRAGVIPVPNDIVQKRYALDESTLLGCHNGTSIQIVFDPKGRYLITDMGGSYSRLRMWKLDDKAAMPFDICNEARRASTLIRLNAPGSRLAMIDQLAGPIPAHGVRVSAFRQLRMVNLEAMPTDLSISQLDSPTNPLFTESGSDRWLATRFSTGTRFWDLLCDQPLENPVFVRNATKSRTPPVAVTSPDGRWLVTCDQLIDLSAWPDQSLEIPASSDSSHVVAACSTDGHWALSGDQLYDLTRSEPDDSPVTLTLPNEASRALFSPDGRWLATTTSKNVQVRDLTSADPAQVTHEFEVPATRRIPISIGNRARSLSLKFSAAGDWLLIASYVGAPRKIMNMSSAIVTECPVAQTGSFNQGQFTPDSRWLMLSGTAGFRLMNLHSGQQELPTVDLRGPSKNRRSRPIVSSDGRWFTVTGEAPLSLWDLTSEDPSTSVVKFPGDQSQVLAISPDARWLVTTPFPRPTGRTDIGTYHREAWLQLWDLTADDPTERPAKQITGHQGWGTVLGFDPNGNWIVTSGNRLVRLWRLPQQGVNP